MMSTRGTKGRKYVGALPIGVKLQIGDTKGKSKSLEGKWSTEEV